MDSESARNIYKKHLHKNQIRQNNRQSHHSYQHDQPDYYMFYIKFTIQYSCLKPIQASRAARVRITGTAWTPSADGALSSGG